MMTSVSILLVAAFLCLLGERQTGNRNGLVIITLAGILGSTIFIPSQFTFGICTTLVLMSLLVGVSQMRATNLESGEAYALLLVANALLLLLCSVTNLLDFVVLTAFFNVSLVGLAFFRRSKRLVSEITLKLMFSALFYCCFLSIAVAVALEGTGTTDFATLASHPEGKLALSFVWIALLLWIGCVPFFALHVDFVDAAPPFASILLLGGSLLSGGVVMSALCQHALDPTLFDILTFFAGASILIPPILGLDQRRIGRMVAYLLMTQSGMLLLLVMFQVSALPIFYLNLAIVIPGALAGVRFWKHAKHSDKNWEDYAGAGRKHPYVAFFWLFILASSAGAPATLGSYLYEEVVKAGLKADAFWILPLVIVAIVVSMVPITRLGIFMFAKPIRHELTLLHQPRQAFLIITCGAFIFATNLVCLALPQSHGLQNLISQLLHLKL